MAKTDPITKHGHWKSHNGGYKWINDPDVTITWKENGRPIKDFDTQLRPESMANGNKWRMTYYNNRHMLQHYAGVGGDMVSDSDAKKAAETKMDRLFEAKPFKPARNAERSNDLPAPRKRDRFQSVWFGD